MATEKTGKVYLVGAGPGDVAYLTHQAQQLLADAEVAIYDALVDTKLLELSPATCERFYVGKRGGQPSWQQSEINQLLVEQCQLGKQVVRLKSGDPFIFGRSSSEIQALISAGCQFEVVPGISSALAAPLLAGIPLTDPLLSQCFAVLSAHEPAELDWPTLAQIDTLAILMGGGHLEEIVRHLLLSGRSPETPIAIIRACGTDQQQIWTGTLADIVAHTTGQSLSPSVIVIGEVVQLRDRLNPEVERNSIEEQNRSDRSEKSLGVAELPLSGKTILITRSAGQSSEFRDRLEQLGATAIDMPVLEIGPPSSWAQLDGAIAGLQDFDWLIFTSTNGVDYFFERLFAVGKDARAIAGVKIAVVGKKTAASLLSRSLQPDFIPPDFVADALVAYFPEDILHKKILFPRVETGGREVLVAEFTAKGAAVVEVAAYESRRPKAIAPEAWEALLRHEIDVITFASSKTVQYFCQLVGEIYEASLPGDLLEGVCVASIGPQTSKSCKSFLGRVDAEAQEYTMEGLTQAIVQWGYTLNQGSC